MASCYIDGKFVTLAQYLQYFYFGLKLPELQVSSATPTHNFFKTCNFQSNEFQP